MPYRRRLVLHCRVVTAGSPPVFGAGGPATASHGSTIRKLQKEKFTRAPGWGGRVFNSGGAGQSTGNSGYQRLEKRLSGKCCRLQNGWRAVGGQLNARGTERPAEGGRGPLCPPSNEVDTAVWLDPPPLQKGSIDGTPIILLRLTTPAAPGVTRARNSAKNEIGIFGISASRGFRKIIICYIFGGKKKDNFQLSKIFGVVGIRFHNK